MNYIKQGDNGSIVIRSWSLAGYRFALDTRRKPLLIGLYVWHRHGMKTLFKIGGEKS